MQCSQTLTRCSKQNWLVTLLFGHLQSPIMKDKFWNFFDFVKCQIFVAKFLLFSQLMTCVRLRKRGQIKVNPTKCKIFQAKICQKVEKGTNKKIGNDFSKFQNILIFQE